MTRNFFMEYTGLTLNRDGAVATITINRPEAANGLDMDTTISLMDAAITCSEDSTIRVVILTGAGDRFFTAGGDLKAFMSMGDEVGKGVKLMTTYLHQAVSRLTRMSAPLVCAVNGIAAGAGVSLAAIGDLTIAKESASFTLAYTNGGLSPDGSSTFFLPRLIGLRRTQELMITNRKLSASEAADWGLITKAVPDADFDAEVQALAQKLANGPTQAYGGVKSMLAETFGSTLEHQMELEARIISKLIQGKDAQEGMRAFAAKERPNYKGQS
jgi:2-(1,2-epoxy-1,2-dihydrophenyl)acetyl-CoA isomerase